MPIKVIVKPHDPRWKDLFAEESKSVAEALGPNVVTIHHIGSTAIPTIHAKPIIDMLVEARSVGDIDTRNSAMKALGYEAMGEFGIPGRRFFRKDDPSGVRTHHVHCFATGSLEIERHLAFRDFMLEHSEDARQYSDLKRRLAAQYPDDIDSYMAGKDSFIKMINMKAAAWRSLM